MVCLAEISIINVETNWHDRWKSCLQFCNPARLICQELGVSVATSHVPPAGRQNAHTPSCTLHSQSVSQSVTPSGSLSSLVMILSITTMRTLKYFYISLFCTVYTYLYNTQLLKNCLKLNPLKIQQDVTSLSGGGWSVITWGEMALVHNIPSISS